MITQETGACCESTKENITYKFKKILYFYVRHLKESVTECNMFWSAVIAGEVK